MSFENCIKAETDRVTGILEEYLPKVGGCQKTVIEAMNYSFLAGGKRLRPLIMLKTYEAFGGNDSFIEPFMVALEMIHNYSLVHDDLPEMDNDSLRRGMPTTHVKFGAGMAVLAGDGLLNYAFETAFKAFDECTCKEDYEKVSDALKVLGAKAGIYGMIGGQCLDVEAEEKSLTLSMDEILFIDENKTAALLQAALMIGGIMAGANEEAVKQLEEIGRKVGIAFQLQDDILDIVSTTEVLGKPVGSDERNGKATYISINGLEKTVAEQKKLSAEAVDSLENMKNSFMRNEKAADFLIELVRSLVSRKM